uniref:Battenin n=1 Tax=Minutocellus polymorphus TaxID=265543 RepID=A0A7S0AUP9_9STRA
MAYNSNDQNVGCGSYSVDEEGRLLTNETCTRGESRSHDDIDGRGSGLELSRGAGGLPMMPDSQDDVEPFEDEYHEVNSLHGDDHHGGGEDVDIPSLRPLERLKLSASFWPYMVPLFTVYAAEYALQAGAWTAIGFPVDSEEARDQFYEYSNWTYQAGVFLSRSSGTVYQASMAVFWLMPILQCMNLVFFTVLAATHFWYDYTMLILCFYVGLLGGGVYVNGFLRINSDLPRSVREFALATVSVADTIGIVVADISGLFIQSCLYQRNGIAGAVVQCPLQR